MTVAQLAADTPTRSWQRLSAGAGTKGDRLYSWAWHTTTETLALGSVRCWCAATTPPVSWRSTAATALPGPIGCVGRSPSRRWTVEESFQSSKGLTSLDQHQVRTWTSWHRWTILVMLAHAILAIATAEQRAHETTNPSLIRLSINEFQRLLAAGALTTERTLTRLLEWSLWRRDISSERRHATKTAGHKHEIAKSGCGTGAGDRWLWSGVVTPRAVRPLDSRVPR